MKILFLVIINLLLSISANAETFPSKDWLWNTDRRDFYFAATVNDAGHTLGQYCYFQSGTCLYLIGLGINCEKGNEYPALINADTGAVHVRLGCLGKFEEHSIFYISAFDDVDLILRNSSRVGIAFPMQGDQFKVSRFGLSGSTYAINQMRAATQKKIQRQPQNVSKPPAEENL